MKHKTKITDDYFLQKGFNHMTGMFEPRDDVVAKKTRLESRPGGITSKLSDAVIMSQEVGNYD
jgi:hypothetical protein